MHLSYYNLKKMLALTRKGGGDGMKFGRVSKRYMGFFDLVVFKIILGSFDSLVFK